MYRNAKERNITITINLDGNEYQAAVKLLPEMLKFYGNEKGIERQRDIIDHLAKGIKRTLIVALARLEEPAFIGADILGNYPEELERSFHNGTSITEH